MSDLTNTFLKGIIKGQTYKPYDVSSAINRIDRLSCDLDDEGGNWELILLHEENRNKYKTGGYLSRYYPVAILKDYCPEKLINILRNYNVFIEFFDESFSCDEDVLRKYAPFTRILDDRFLDDGNFSLDDERLFYIYENIKYVTPYSFTFDEIR